MQTSNWTEILQQRAEDSFEQLALDVFRYQAEHNAVYREFVQTLGRDPANIDSLLDIPFLPIEFFKTHRVVTGSAEPVLHFESSGTTGQTPSRHFVSRPKIYEWSYLQGFERAFGKPEEYCILALLPSYLEREHSSLVCMAKGLIDKSTHPDSGFYLHDLDKLADTLQRLAGSDQKVLLIGVSFALLDLAEQYPIPLRQIQVMETGGMKGRRKEMIREELHEVLKEAFDKTRIYSEYGMTELLSQAYTNGHEWFTAPPWMQVLVRDPYDALDVRFSGSGALNVIDLANIDSCSFIATGDLGKVSSDDQRFQVLGRMDSTEIRGCNLMVG